MFKKYEEERKNFTGYLCYLSKELKGRTQMKILELKILYQKLVLQGLHSNAHIAEQSYIEWAKGQLKILKWMRKNTKKYRKEYKRHMEHSKKYNTCNWNSRRRRETKRDRSNIYGNTN